LESDITKFKVTITDRDPFIVFDFTKLGNDAASLADCVLDI